VSDTRDSIGLVAGNIEHVKAVGEDLTYVRAATLLEPMFKEALKLSTNIDLVLDMEEKIDKLLDESSEVDGKMGIIRDYMRRASNSAIVAVNMVNKANVIERRMDEKLKKMEEIYASMTEFRVSVEHVGSEDSPRSVYDRTNNNLELSIPAGKTGPRGNYKGDKGESGDDGKDFSVSYQGLRRERGRYCNHPVGTSYLSLDEIPTMIYFRKSNANDDWTDGQPFGVGGEFYEKDDTSIVNGINVQRLTDQVMYELDKRKG